MNEELRGDITVKTIVTIMRGMPGVGKTTWLNHNIFGTRLICRSDDLGYELGEQLGEPGSYIFKSWDIAHKRTLWLFLQGLQMAANQPTYYSADINNYLPALTHLVVDSTNLSHYEIAPYIKAAESYGFEPRIIDVWAPLGVVLARDERPTRGVSIGKERLLQMLERKREAERTWPKTWPSTTRYCNLASELDPALEYQLPMAY